MGNRETIKRLRKAFDADIYVNEIRKKMSYVMDYSLNPLMNEPTDIFKQYQFILSEYTKQWWGDLLPNENNNTDMSVAIGWAIIAEHQQKILKTKHKNELCMLDSINDRLSLYIEYQWYWLNNKNWNFSPYHIFNTYKAFGYLPINIDPEPMQFTQWLYINGYESLLNESEFLSAIAYFDEN